MKAFNNFLFVASFLIVSALVIACSGCSRQDKAKKEPASSQPQQSAQVTPPPTPATVSVDFDQAPLADVALFVTHQTGKSFVVNGVADTPLTWIEYSIAKEKVFDSFRRTLTAAGLVLKSTEDKQTFVIAKAEEEKVPVRLDFATSSRGTFFLLGSRVYSMEQFPYPTHKQGGHWFASLPKSLADQLSQDTKQTAKL